MEWKKKVFYHIYPLGFCGVKHERPNPFEPKRNLHKIEEWIGHLKELGTNAVYLGPVFSSSHHGYDTTDYYHIDSRLGTNDDFKKLCGKLKAADIKIVLDGVFHHVGREFWAFRDVLRNREHSPYCDWFSGLRFDGNNRHNDCFSYDCWEGHEELVKLNLGNQDVINHILGAVASWIKDYQIDGLRLDVAYALDMNFIKRLSSVCKKSKPDFLLLGEVIHGSYGNWIDNDKLDSVTNYECYKGIYSAHNDKNLFEIAHSMERQFGDRGLYKNLALYNFVDNHDVNRLASNLRNPAHVYTSYILLFTMPGIPSIYYGSEWAIEGMRTHTSDDTLRPCIHSIKNQTKNFDVICAVRKLISIRQKYRLYEFRDFSIIKIEPELFIFNLKNGNSELIVMININDTIKEAHIPVHAEGVYNDILNNNEKFYPTGKHITLPVFAHWGRILLKE